MILVTMITLLATLVVLVRAVCLATKMSAARWEGHPLRFAGLSVTYSLLAAGSLAVTFGRPYAAILLLLGVAGMFLTDRRVLR